MLLVIILSFLIACYMETDNGTHFFTGQQKKRKTFIQIEQSCSSDKSGRLNHAGYDLNRTVNLIQPKQY